MRANPLVSVEADEIIDQSHSTSVIVQGRYEELLDTPDRRNANWLMSCFRSGRCGGTQPWSRLLTWLLRKTHPQCITAFTLTR